jgi:hypothetical protein
MIEIVAVYERELFQPGEFICNVDDEVDVAFLEIKFLDVHAIRDLLHVPFEFALLITL